MNILYILHSTYPLGGASKSFLTLIKGVQEQGHTPIVVAPDKEGVAITLRQMGVEVITIPFRTNTYPDLRNAKEAILFLPRLVARRILIHKAVNTVYNLVKSKKIAMIHSNVSVVDVGERVAKRLGIPHIYHIREYADVDFGLHYFPSSKTFHKQLAANYAICITKAIQRHHHRGLLSSIMESSWKRSKMSNNFPQLPICSTRAASKRRKVSWIWPSPTLDLQKEIGLHVVHWLSQER